MNTTAHRARPHRTSEGTASAQAINAMPHPYLLDTSTLPDDRAVVVAGNPEQRPAKRPYKPLRLIKSATASPLCGFGTCALDPECTRPCRYREAAVALRTDNPPAQPAQTNPLARRITWALIALWCAGWVIGPIVWWLTR